ncbi:hypothetical protein NPIL_160361 [Nephila pilipes]|uniref:Uncharacterized protein n=1 Tax=Nephila pilipes TaxID=299642 RepID=A0A8X6QW17_NEPPI|nr:hypothetical protein NPIL_160361 [Nephila pilipes]
MYKARGKKNDNLESDFQADNAADLINLTDISSKELGIKLGILSEINMMPVSACTGRIQKNKWTNHPITCESYLHKPRVITNFGKLDALCYYGHAY